MVWKVMPPASNEILYILESNTTGKSVNFETSTFFFTALLFSSRHSLLECTLNGKLYNLMQNQCSDGSCPYRDQHTKLPHALTLRQRVWSCENWKKPFFLNFLVLFLNLFFLVNFVWQTWSFDKKKTKKYRKTFICKNHIRYSTKVTATCLIYFSNREIFIRIWTKFKGAWTKNNQLLKK